MPRHALKIDLSEAERQEVERWRRAGKTEKRMLPRIQIIEMAAQGLSSRQIAARLQMRRPTVLKWRQRFGQQRLEGLHDAPRSGPPRRYTADTERRILAQLDQPPPTGRARWNGRLLAQALGDVSPHQVWAVLRKHGIELERRHSWCVSTDPEFARKAADIVGLYLDPPAGAVVLSVDEKPAIQVLERAQGWLRLPNGRSLRGFNHEYKRHGTTTLFAALEVFTGTVTAAHYPRRRRREFLEFMNQVVAAHSGRELHVIMDNLSSHKPKHDRWLARHPNVRFHYTPTHASWLNQIECWFSILSRQALKGASFTLVAQLRKAIDHFVAGYNETAAPFEWTKRAVQQGQLKHRYAYLII
ncbi:MAG: IS630 family transposase [Terriglobia bacterium]